MEERERPTDPQVQYSGPGGMGQPETSLEEFRRPARWLMFLTWFVCLTSLGEIAWKARLKWLGYSQPVPQYMWWIPLGDLLLMLPVAIVVAVALRRRSPRVFYLGAIGVMAFQMSLGLALAPRKFHPAAAAVLALGLAAQLTRAGTISPQLTSLLVRRSAPWLAVLSTVLAAAALVAPIFEERRAVRQLPTPAAGTPNVLFIVLDTVRAKSLGLYGYAKARTPSLDAFASRSVVFDRALSTAPWTLPSHAAMFTGHWPHELNIDFYQPLGSKYPTLAELFAQSGYLTAGFAANTIYVDKQYGLNRGFAHYEGQPTTPMAAITQTSTGNMLETTVGLARFLGHEEKFNSMTAAEVNRRFLDWMHERDESRPFFAFLNYFDAHDPYFVPDTIRSQFTQAEPVLSLDYKLDTFTEREIEGLNASYDAALSYLDSQLGQLLDSLERDKTLENTIVVITADHGEQFGEHRMLVHAGSLYTPLIHVPLMVSFPREFAGGARVGAFVSLRDIGATVLDLAHRAQARTFPGRSLKDYLTAGRACDGCQPLPLLVEANRVDSLYPDWYPARKGRMRSVVMNGHQYIRNYGDGREELYDLTVDFEANHDLAPEHPELLPEYRTHLDTLLKPRTH